MSNSMVQGPFSKDEFYPVSYEIPAFMSTKIRN